MATKYEVRVTAASVTDGRFRTTCACTCGWQGSVEEDRAPAALSAAAKARVDHLLEAHPKQTPSAFFRPRAAARYRHPRSISAAIQQGKRYRRHAACACGWTATVRGRTPRGTGHRARERHQAHVDLQTGRTPGRDYLVMGALVVLMGVLLVGLAMIAVQAGGGDFSSLLG